MLETSAWITLKRETEKRKLLIYIFMFYANNLHSLHSSPLPRFLQTETMM